VSVWLPTGYLNPIVRVCEGKERAQAPVRKKVPGTHCSDRVERIFVTPSAFATASKVSATTLAVVGSVKTSVPAKRAGSGRSLTAGGEVHQGFLLASGETDPRLAASSAAP